MTDYPDIPAVVIGEPSPTSAQDFLQAVLDWALREEKKWTSQPQS